MLQLVKGAFKTRWRADTADWSFWIEWYEAVRDGTWTDWDLICKIATEVTDRDCDQGQEHVAARIAEIRQAHLQSGQNGMRQPAFEPQSVEYLFRHSHVVASNAQSVALDVVTAVEKFQNESGLNTVPEAFKPLEAMPSSLVKIAKLLSSRRISEAE